MTYMTRQTITRQTSKNLNTNSTQKISILCVGDVHIKTNNIHLVDLLEQQIVQYIQSHQIEFVVLLGDILDTFERIHTQALNRAYQLIDSIRKHSQVYILVGNHDYINNQQFLTTNHWLNALKDWKNVTVVDTVYGLRQSFVFVPYVPVKRFVEALDQFKEFDWKTAQIIFAHQEFKGSKMGAIISSEGDEWQSDYPLVVSGHIHDRQQPQENIFYIGASIQNSFGDQTLPVLLWINNNESDESNEVDDSKHTPYTLTPLPLELPRKKTVYTDIEKIQELNAKELLEQKNLDMVRIVVKCDYEQFKVFAQSKQYEQLQSHSKCKIVHKLPESKPSEPMQTSNGDEQDSNPSSTRSEIGEINTLNDFDTVLYHKVLHTRNSYIFSMYHEIIHDTSISAEDVLIV